MGRSPKKIRQLLTKQARSGLSISTFCDRNELNRGTFYAWRVKYKVVEDQPESGFTQIIASPPSCGVPATVLHLSDGARLELSDWPLERLIIFTRQLINHAEFI